MVYSMTGYGACKGASDTLDISIEIKSVNNRYFDCSVRIPRIYAFSEEHIKARVQSVVSRGKIDVFINLDSSKADNVTIKVNEPLLKAYLDAFSQMSRTYGVENDVSVSELSRLPDVFTVEKLQVDTEAFLKDITKVLDGALAAFNNMRAVEGGRLCSDIRLRLDEIERLSATVEERFPESVEAYRTKLRTKMTELLENSEIDEQRILLEAALFADKTAVDEELTRLKSHISQMRSLLETGGPGIGRKLDFIVQELNREANTTGSKSADLGITHVIVDMKAEIEKIREQAQNIE